MRKRKIGLVMAVGLLAMVLGGSATASGDPLSGTWHQRDAGTSNIFYFIDAPVGGVYPVLFYDDHTGTDICGDNGPMMWTGFLTETSENTFEGSFGSIFCPDNGDGAHESGFVTHFSVPPINYDVATGGDGTDMPWPAASQPQPISVGVVPSGPGAL